MTDAGYVFDLERGIPYCRAISGARDDACDAIKSRYLQRDDCDVLFRARRFRRGGSIFNAQALY